LELDAGLALEQKLAAALGEQMPAGWCPESVAGFRSELAWASVWVWATAVR
jgi:hypothetical protein